MKHSWLLFLLIVPVLLLSGCFMLEPNIHTRTQYVTAHPDTQYRSEILAGDIKVGMSKAEVLAAWGPPCGYCAGTTHSSWGDSWDYDVFGSAYGGGGTIVYFDAAGYVTGWSD